MILSQDAIQEFKDLYHKKYGKDLTDKDAREMAEELLNLCSLSAGKQLN